MLGKALKQNQNTANTKKNPNFSELETQIQRFKKPKIQTCRNILSGYKFKIIPTLLMTSHVSGFNLIP